MIADRDKNTIYFSDKIRMSLKYQPAFDRIKALLDIHQVNYRFLSNTKDIWCRDYMPVQVSNNEFVQFRYEPTYLEEYLHLQSSPKDVLRSNNLKTQFSQINLDGGNVVSWTDKAILTTRIFKENPKSDQSKLIDEIERLLKVQILLIPDINPEFDMTGHADGHLRFIDSNTVLVNELRNEFGYWKRGFDKMIKTSEIGIVEMPWFEPSDNDPEHSAIGCYVNYLEVGNLILFPVFEVSGNRDEEALKVIHSVFPERTIEPVNINEIGRAGGLLNCSTWTIKT